MSSEILDGIANLRSCSSFNATADALEYLLRRQQESDAEILALKEKTKEIDSLKETLESQETEIGMLREVNEKLAEQMSQMGELFENFQSTVEATQSTQKEQETKMLKINGHFDALDPRVAALESLVPEVAKNTEDISKLSELVVLIRKAVKEFKVQLKKISGGDVVTKPWVIQLIDELSQNVNRLAKKNNQDLREFADDLEQALRSMKIGGGGSKSVGQAAAGRIHFRCLTCDRPLKDIKGPRSNAYTRSIEGRDNLQTIGLGFKGPGGKTPRATVRKGEEETLYGSDGGIYKGRERDSVKIAGAMPPNKGEEKYDDECGGAYVHDHSH